MRDFPVFIPYDGARLAAVITAPDGHPDGLVVLLTGGGAARSHRAQLWTRAAERLAKQGLASLRLDYQGTGDSTGVAPELHMTDPPTDQALAAVRFSLDALGVERVAGVGNCMGARIALDLAAELPEWIGTLCINPPILRPARVTRAIQRARGWKLPSTLKSSALLRNSVVRPLKRRKKRITSTDREPIVMALERGPVCLVYSEKDSRLTRQLRRELQRLEGALPERLKARYEVRLLQGVGLLGFQSLLIQQEVIDTVGDWVPRCFSAAPVAAT